MLNILITGANGFIGRHLTNYLNNLGYNISCIGHNLNDKINISDNGYLKNWISGDINQTNLQKVYSKQKPDLIFHLAGGATVSQAEKNPEEDYFKNVTSTYELLEHIRLNSPQVKLVLASSASVYGANFSVPIKEDDKIEPCSVYGKNKRKAELLCQHYLKTHNINYSIIRFFSVYGPGLKKQLLWELSMRLYKNQLPLVLGGTGKEIRDWIYIDDAIKLLAFIGIKKINTSKGLIVNGGTGVGKTVKQITELVAKEWNNNILTSSKIKFKFSGQKRFADPFSLVSNSEKLLNLGTSCKIFTDKGIKSYIEWFKKEQKL